MVGVTRYELWPQQLNFAVWCATTGCGVSSRLLLEDEKFSYIPKTDGGLRLPKQVRSFLWFHVYFQRTHQNFFFSVEYVRKIKAYLFFLSSFESFPASKNPYLHVYFTVRRILHELGGIQNSVALPGDDAFD